MRRSRISSPWFSKNLGPTPFTFANSLIDLGKAFTILIIVALLIMTKAGHFIRPDFCKRQALSLR